MVEALCARGGLFFMSSWTVVVLAAVADTGRGGLWDTGSASPRIE